MKRYDLQSWVDAGKVPPGAELESSQPARVAGILADVAVPFLQSTISGGMIAGVVVMISSLAGWNGDGFKLWASVAVTVSAISWLLLLADTRRLLWGIERVLGADIDGDGTAGHPAERLVFVNREKARQEATQARQADEWGQFVAFVKALQYRGTGYDAWESVLGRSTYIEYRDCLLDYNFARWRSYGPGGKPNVRQGWELTLTPAQILERLQCD